MKAAFTTLTIAAMMCVATSAHAAFNLVEDFEDLSDWTKNGTAAELASVTGPAGSNGNVAELTHDTQNVSAQYKSLGGDAIADGSVGTVFFRIYAPSTTEEFSHWFGVTDNNSPQEFNTFRGYGGLPGTPANAAAPSDIVFRNGSEGTTVTIEGSVARNTWYNVWLVFNNAAGTGSDSYDVYLTTGNAAATAGDRIADDYEYRNGGVAGALDTIALFGGNNANRLAADDIAYFDDVYVDNSGENLNNPIPEPASLALLALGGVAMLRRK